ncbi:DUF1453 domain-containing protein [Tsukamurella paurometabola]|uniref:Uncharacterized protein n=1 Tax=Tsukamurella paurometabola TaxID=2061 RepID=A0A3P8M9P7_TSUPA|nr:DUF1453 domain-containing protein [Tsukamurella paurometabola]UEA84720.1 hypothetical protein LK411_07850 [Tsukamurella paurometabola]VDR37300.1 Uncharacterised protein [Tsukamurella paurometabola]
MADAVIVAAIFLVLVLTTQLGTRRHTLVLAVMPFITSAVIGYAVLGTGSHRYAAGDGALIAAGIVVGAVCGLALNAVMDVRRDPARGGHLVTRAGLPYLAIWVGVLLSRCAFIAAVEHSEDFAIRFGAFLDRIHGSPDGVAAFFLVAALAMSLTREVTILVRSRRIPRTPPARAVPEQARR